MATIIDELIVKFGLDNSGFEKNRTKVNKDLKDTGKQAEDAGNKFKGLAQAAGAFLAVIGGSMAIRSFIEHTITANASLDRLSKNLNVNANEISAWSNAAEQAGGSASGLQGTMDMLSKSQTELMLTGQSGLIPFFSALGLSLADTSGKARPVNDLLLDLSGKFSGMDRTTANNMGRMMGIDQGTMNLLLKGRQEIEMTIKRQKEYGAVTKKQAEESSRLQKAMIETKQTFSAFARELLSSALPVIEKLVKMFSDFGNWIRENQEFVKTFLSILAVGLAAVAAATRPINLAAAAVLGLAAAIAALKQDYDTWKRGGESLIDWKKWEPGIMKAGYAIRWLRDLLGDVIYRTIAAADIVEGVQTGNFKQVKAAFQEFKKGNGQKYGKEELPTVFTPSTGGGAGSRIGADRSQEAIAYFRSQGWSTEQAVGIAANLQHESQYNPRAVGDYGQAYGIAQWHPDRQANFARLFGKSIKQSTFEEQLAFIQYELTRGGEQRAGNMLRNTTSAKDAAAIVSTEYERPKYTNREASRRGALAQSMMAGIPNASNMAIGAGAMANVPSVNNTKIDTHIGEIKVYSAATDADGIAKDMGKSMNVLFANQGNYGLF
jgi:hypothetical protein